MDDKTMLEWAARAVGIDGQIKDHGGQIWLLNREDGGEAWNPLIDDGDEARLESALYMDVGWYDDYVQITSTHGRFREVYAVHGGDKQRARRFAGVRAAAEIGKAMGRG